MESIAPEVAGLDAAVAAEQTRLLLHDPTDVPINLINAAIFGAMLVPLYPIWVLATWLATFALVSLARARLRHRYARASGGVETSVHWARRFTLHAFAAGTLWGLAGSAILVTPDPVYQMFVVFVLGGMLAAGIVTTAAYLPATLAFMVPTIVPAIAALIVRGELVQLEMAVMLALFAVALFLTGRRINRSIIENVRLRIEQVSLLTRLQAGEAAMAEAQAVAHVGSWTFDVRSRVLQWTAETFRIFGVDPNSFQPSYEAAIARAHPRDRAALREKVAALFASGTGLALDHRIVMDDGTIKHVHEIGHAKRDAEGGVATIIGTMQDVTERTNADGKLQFANSLLEAEMEASPDGILVVDANRKVISFNQRFSDIWKIPLSDLQHGDDAKVLPKVTAAVKNPAEFEARVQYLFSHPGEDSHDALETLDGRFIDRYTSTLMTPAKTYLGRVWYFRDVTEREVAANALAYRDRLLHAVTIGTGMLVQAASLAEGMPAALQLVGEVVRVDRVLVLQDHPGHEGPPTLPYAWQMRDIRVPIDSSAFAVPPADRAAMIAWREPLARGESVTAKAATSAGPVRAMLERFESKSTLLVPIFVGEKLWGNLGIDDVKQARDWTASEINTLRTFADNVGSLIVRDEARDSLATSVERLRVLSATAQDAIVTLDGAGRISQWNQAAERILGYGAEEAVGRRVHEFLVPERYQAKADQGLETFLVTGKGGALDKTTERAALRKDGVEIAVEISLAGAQLGGQWQAIAILRDITERKQAAADALRLARYDVLTGLANRAVFVEALQHAIALARREAQGFAVIYLDLDHFKDVNDTLGHPAGDELLKSVADRLRANTLDTDTVARFGGDEFAVVVPDAGESAGAAILADKLLVAMSQPVTIMGNEIYSGASIGIAVYGADAADAETLLSHADVALYRAKSEGRGGYRFYTAAMDVDVQKRVTLGRELRDAIDAGQLFLMYQPQIAIENGKICGVEALVRWRHPRLGILGPNLFIPIAEQIGVISKLGHWVLWTACRQTRAWLDEGITPIRIGVNVSALQLKMPLVLEADIADALAQTGLPPALLELELTESVLMDASREHSGVFQRLRATGITVAIDDFGTGYSSLEYLRRFPSNRIKIAQNFVKNLATAKGDVAIVRATIGLARELGIEVIAEGVETAEQLELLRSWGCPEVQGYYFAPPLTLADATAVLHRGEISRPRGGSVKPVAARS